MDIVSSHEESGADRERFIASLAHEVRTPLTAVIGMLELLSDGEELDGAIRDEFLRIAHTQAIEVARVLDDLLAAVRLATDSLTVQDVDVDLGATISAALASVSVPDSVAIDRSESGEGAVTGDPIYVRQIVRSLLKNAVRFARNGIGFSTQQVGSTRVLDIANDGDPIPSAQVDALFTPYVTQSRAGDNGSLGLGLAVGRQLARRMGGDLVLLENRDRVVFRLTLRCADVGGSPTPPRTPLGLVAGRAMPPGPDVRPIMLLSDGSVAGYMAREAAAAQDRRTGSIGLPQGIPPNTVLFLPSIDVARLAAATDLDRLVAIVDATEIADEVRRRGGLVAAHWMLPTLALRSVAPHFLLFHVAEAEAHPLSEVVDAVAAVAMEVDAWVLATGVETPGQLAVLREAKVPLVTGPFIGSEGDRWPGVSDEARAVAARSALEFQPRELMARLVGSHAGPRSVAPSSGMRALASDRIDHTLRRAMRRPRNERFAPVSVVDSVGRILDSVPIEMMVDALHGPSA